MTAIDIVYMQYSIPYYDLNTHAHTPGLVENTLYKLMKENVKISERINHYVG